MKYNVGDKVRIKSLDWYNENKDEYGCIQLDYEGFIPKMSRYCGEILTIKQVVEECKHYFVSECGFAWSDEMIEGLVEEETKQEPKFKVGDILFYRGETCGYLKVEEIREENGEIRYYETSRNLYLIENDPNVFADKVCSVETEETKNNNDMIEGLVEEESLIERVDDSGLPFNEWLSHKGAFYVPNGYEIKDENGNIINTTKIVLEKKSPKTDTIIKWLREHDMTKYIGVIYSGMCSITFDTEGLIKDFLETVEDNE